MALSPGHRFGQIIRGEFNDKLSAIGFLREFEPILPGDVEPG